MSDVMEIDGLSATRAMDWENGFSWFSHPSRLNKILAYYELYQMVMRVPGDIIEMGVFKGTTLLHWASFRQVLENDHARKIVGFDTFDTFPTKGVTLDVDLEFIEAFDARAGKSIDKVALEKILKQKGFVNVELLKGNVMDTLPHFIQSNPALRIALLHLDLSVKEPSEFALNALYDRVVPGGLIVINDYTSAVGATEAVDDLIEARGLSVEKLPFHSAPAFIRKPKKGEEHVTLHKVA